MLDNENNFIRLTNTWQLGTLHNESWFDLMITPHICIYQIATDPVLPCRKVNFYRASKCNQSQLTNFEFINSAVSLVSHSLTFYISYMETIAPADSLLQI